MASLGPDLLRRDGQLFQEKHHLRGLLLHSDPSKLGLSTKSTLLLSGSSDIKATSSPFRGPSVKPAMPSKAAPSLLVQSRMPLTGGLSLTSNKTLTGDFGLNSGKMTNVEKKKPQPTELTPRLANPLLSGPSLMMGESLLLSKSPTVHEVHLHSSLELTFTYKPGNLVTEGPMSHISATVIRPTRPAHAKQPEPLRKKVQRMKPAKTSKPVMKSTPARTHTTRGADKARKVAKKEKRVATVDSKHEPESTAHELFEYPWYQLEKMDDEKIYEIEKFPQAASPLDCHPVFDVIGVKKMFVNTVSASLLRQPDFKQKLDPVRLDLLDIGHQLAVFDPEFILKMALYTRNELNVRVTANFLLAFAAYKSECRPYLRKYFSISIRLPSDWIDVAVQYQVFDDSNIRFGGLPAALRRAMVTKFPDFDKYQLAKYNKDNASKKKKVPTATLR